MSAVSRLTPHSRKQTVSTLTPPSPSAHPTPTAINGVNDNASTLTPTAHPSPVHPPTHPPLPPDGVGSERSGCDSVTHLHSRVGFGLSIAPCRMPILAVNNCGVTQRARNSAPIIICADRSDARSACVKCAYIETTANTMARLHRTVCDFFFGGSRFLKEYFRRSLPNPTLTLTNPNLTNRTLTLN